MKVKSAWILLIYSFLVLVLCACSRFKSETTVDPVEVVFDAPTEAIEGGIRLALPENKWDGYGEAVDVRDDVLVVGAPGEFGNSAYVFRLLPAEER